MSNEWEADNRRRHDDSMVGDVIADVRRAIALNEARDVATANALRELSPGAVPGGWPYSDVGPELIRTPLRNAETLLGEHVDMVNLGDGSTEISVPADVITGLDELDRDTVRNMMIEKTLYRLNASWSYVDIVGWEPLVRFDETPILYLLIELPLGKPHKKRKLLGEEHNLSGIHFHYAKLDGQRSDILFGFGRNPPDPLYLVKWERHGTGKAKFKPEPENWNYAKRGNINMVCCAARDDMAADTRFFTPSKESEYLLPM